MDAVDADLQAKLEGKPNSTKVPASAATENTTSGSSNTGRVLPPHLRPAFESKTLGGGGVSFNHSTLFDELGWKQWQSAPFFPRVLI